MTDVTYPLFPIFAFLGFILPLVPLQWHLQALNSGTCYFILWSSLACLNQFINSVIWANNALNSSPIWCEISIRIMMASSVAIPAASLCINRRLYHIANVQTASLSLAEKQRAILIDSLICVLFPLIYVALQYIVQGHRFNILENIGCYPALYNTIPTFFISSVWPLLLGLVSAVYCVLTLRAFTFRRAEFGRFLSSNTTLTISRYFRLMALAMTEICATIPLSIFVIWINATAAPISPWRGWEDTHFDYSRVEQFPAIVWRSNHLTVLGVEFSRWISPLCALIFFAFFGFAHESKRNYRRAWNWLKSTLHIPSAVNGPKKLKLQLCSRNSSQKQAISPTLGSFALPLHDLKRSDSINTVVTDLTLGKDSNPYPPSPSPTASTIIIPSPRLCKSSNGPESGIPLERSRTL